MYATSTQKREWTYTPEKLAAMRLEVEKLEFFMENRLKTAKFSLKTRKINNFGIFYLKNSEKVENLVIFIGKIKNFGIFYLKIRKIEHLFHFL